VTRQSLLELLQSVATGGATPDAALERLAWLPVESLNGENGTYARLDHHRAIRHGYPEVVFGPGKTHAQLVDICTRLAERGNGFLVTRVDDAARAVLAQHFPAAVVHELARCVRLAPEREAKPPVFGPVLIASAGTADLPVAEEAAVTAEALGNPVERLYDVGVAGIHRLLGESETLRRASVLIVVAGMEGALPSVIGGLVATPVIAVPTSIGYGAAFGGIAALLAMLSSCAAGITVVNIDNGFGAACAAARINQLRARTP
jgi:NCAIR mutase (PurE)-related protein